MLMLSNTDVTIGFNPEVYSVDEATGIVSLTVRVLAGQLARSVDVDYTTLDGTAISTASTLVLPIILQFSPSDLVQQANVIIIDDDIIENLELFTGSLSSIDPAVILAPDTARVEIQDNDRELAVIFNTIQAGRLALFAFLCP